MTDPEIRFDEAAGRLELVVEGRPCELDFRLEDGAMVITHTGVPPALEGRGLAGRLMQAAVELARERGWQLIPVCSYAASWLRRHPQALAGP